MKNALIVSGSIALPSPAGDLTAMQGAFDYMVKDHLASVRMVLTDEVHESVGTCSMETNRTGTEGPVFGKTGNSNDVLTTRFPAANIPGGWNNGLIGSHVKEGACVLTKDKLSYHIYKLAHWEKQYEGRTVKVTGQLTYQTTEVDTTKPIVQNISRTIPMIKMQNGLWQISQRNELTLAFRHYLFRYSNFLILVKKNGYRINIFYIINYLFYIREVACPYKGSKATGNLGQNR